MSRVIICIIGLLGAAWSGPSLHCNYQGTINGKYAIEMGVAVEGDKVLGSYHYTKNPKGRLFLVGTQNGDSLWLVEFDKTSTGRFQGVFSKERQSLSGVWSNLEGDKKFPFTLSCVDSSFQLPPASFSGWFIDQLKLYPDQPSMVSCHYRLHFRNTKAGLQLHAEQIGMMAHEGEDYEQDYQNLRPVGRALGIPHQDAIDDVFGPLDPGTRISLLLLDVDHLLVGNEVFRRVDSTAAMKVSPH